MSTDHSQNGDGAEGASEERLPDITVADPDNYNIARRLRQIHNARERFPEVVREESERVSDSPRGPGITPGRYRELVADALIDYIIEVEPLMRSGELNKKQDGFGTEFWSEKTVWKAPDGKEVTLQYIVEHDGVVPAEDGDESQAIPINVARKAYRMTNRFVAQVGLGVELDSNLPIEESWDSTGGGL